ncbi:hypothetical protein GE09DRAFT_677945 [Coniochaeta sp. 2T2.1]|nr:hypothetical protein GE09DRAFT_677945 [Coniochaeta sp. 2T2.1]
MSSIVNKVKEALHSDKSDTTHSSTTHNTSTTGTHTTGTHHTSGAPEGSHGPHSSRVANAGDPRVDSDRDGAHPGAQHSAGGLGGHGSSTGGYTRGTGIGLGSSGTREGEHGPHGNRAANALDPRVDSDRDGSHNQNYGSSTGGFTQGTGPTHGSHNTGLGHTAGAAGPLGGHSSGAREGEHGPHSSRAANALDPRVDSDRDGSRNAGAAYGGNTHSTGNTFGSSTHTGTGNTFGSSAHTGTGHTGTGHTGTSGFTTGSNTGAREGEHGPHSSRAANALDPRVDSDRDGSRNAGAAYGSNQFGTTGHNTTSSGLGHTGGTQFGTTGHNTTSSGLGHTGGNQLGTGHSGPGPAPNTAGPHQSDMVNKLDPRVDSDLDGSKTVGGNKTYQSGTHAQSLGHKDPTDAAQVPPSVLARHIGEPEIAHDDHHHGRDRRNSSATHQETYRGV